MVDDRSSPDRQEDLQALRKTFRQCCLVHCVLSFGYQVWASIPFGKTMVHTLWDTSGPDTRGIDARFFVCCSPSKRQNGDTLFSDIDSLLIFAGSHTSIFGYHR